jgi:hypothetical protein
VVQRAKLIAKIRNNTRDVSFEDACKVAVWLGFLAGRGKGLHAAFSRPGEPTGLNFQNRGGKIPPYQARQLLAMIERYWTEGDD